MFLYGSLANSSHHASKASGEIRRHRCAKKKRTSWCDDWQHYLSAPYPDAALQQKVNREIEIEISHSSAFLHSLLNFLQSRVEESSPQDILRRASLFTMGPSVPLIVRSHGMTTICSLLPSHEFTIYFSMQRTKQQISDVGVASVVGLYNSDVTTQLWVCSLVIHWQRIANGFDQICSSKDHPLHLHEYCWKYQWPLPVYLLYNDKYSSHPLWYQW